MSLSVYTAVTAISLLSGSFLKCQCGTLQTGSGKTYTMGTSLKDGCQTGLIPKVMNALFSKIETQKHDFEFQLHVSFIEVCLIFLSRSYYN